MLFVLLNHTGDMVWNHVTNGGLSDLLGELFFNFRFGVEIFFTLSGFLISYLYDYRGNTRGFLLSRFFRLWPLWAVFGGVWLYTHAFVIRDLSAAQASINYLANLFFVGWAVPGPFNWFIGGQWSIQIEIFCYLLFLLVRGRSNTAVLALATCLNLLGIFSATFLRAALPALADAIGKLSVWSGFTFFAVGIILARVYCSENRMMFLHGLLTTTKSRTSLMSFLISTLVAPAFFGNWLGSLGFVVGGIVLAVAINFSGVAGKMLRWFGRHSYFVFFSHFFVLAFIESQFVSVKNLTIPAALVWVLVIASVTALICCATAVVSMKFIEKPAIRFGHQLAAKNKMAR